MSPVTIKAIARVILAVVIVGITVPETEACSGGSEPTTTKSAAVTNAPVTTAAVTNAPVTTTAPATTAPATSPTTTTPIPLTTTMGTTTVPTTTAPATTAPVTTTSVTTAPATTTTTGTTTPATTTTTSTAPPASTTPTATPAVYCCQELDVSFSGNDTALLTNLGQYLEGTWSFGGIVDGMEFYTFQDIYAIWYSPNAPYWIFGPIEALGTNSQIYLYTEGPNYKYFGKCPNNHGQIKWSWNYLEVVDGQVLFNPSNDIHIKCASEDDFCTSTNPCGSEQGDCDSHDECQTGLTCGLDNCGITEDPNMDCCYAATIGDDTFCTTANPCGDNEGGCYTDDDCQSDLKCDLHNECPASLGFNTGVSCCTSDVVCAGKPDWIGDDYCDDENNNEACQYDGDDCCNGGNTQYCTVCECLDPNN